LIIHFKQRKLKRKKKKKKKKKKTGQEVGVLFGELWCMKLLILQSLQKFVGEKGCEGFLDLQETSFFIGFPFYINIYFVVFVCSSLWSCECEQNILLCFMETIFSISQPMFHQ